MDAIALRRRHLLLGSALGAGALLAPFRGAGALEPTQRMMAGPFYPDEIPLDHDNDLAHVGKSGATARGEIAELTGRVVDVSGRALSDVRVEIWQCDATGHYHHVGRESGLDPNFQGYGVATTRADGAYRFRTIKPVRYSGRTPHIHFKLSGQGIDGLTTQMFVAGDPNNADDGIYNSLDPERRAALTVAFRRDARDGAAYAAHFEIVLASDGRSG